MGLKDLARRGRDGARAQLIRQEARRLRFADPRLDALRAALRVPAPGEDAWCARIEARRAELEASTDVISLPVGDPAWWERAIAQSQDPQPPVLRGDVVDRFVGEVTRQTSKSPDWGRLLYRLVVALGPLRCLELGSSLGISGAYIGAGLEQRGAGRLVTLEGQEASAAVARATFEQLVPGRVELVRAWFAEGLPDVLTGLGEVHLAFVDGHHAYAPTLEYFAAILEHAVPGTLLVFDDVVYFSDDGMERAWREIRDHPRVTGSLTIGPVGFAVVDGVPDEHAELAGLALW